MRSHVRAASATAVACMLALPAAAQGQADGTQAGQAPGPAAGAQAQGAIQPGGAEPAGGGTAAGERLPDELTCRELSFIETAAVPGILYFIAGHRAGMEDVAATGDLEAARQRLGTAGVGTDRDPAMEGADRPEPVAEADVPGAANGEGQLGAAERAPHPANVAGATPEAEVVAVRGHLPIPIERTIIACAEAPDARVGDVIQRERGPADEAERDGAQQGG